MSACTVANVVNCLPARETLPFDQLASLAASGSTQQVMMIPIIVVVAIAIGVLLLMIRRRIIDARTVQPYMRHNEGYFDEQPPESAFHSQFG